MHAKNVINLHTKRKKTLNILVEFPVGYLQSGLCSTSVYCASLYTIHRVPGGLIRLADVWSKCSYVQLYIVSKSTVAVLNIYNQQTLNVHRRIICFFLTISYFVIQLLFPPSCLYKYVSCVLFFNSVYFTNFQEMNFYKHLFYLQKRY